MADTSPESPKRITTAKIRRLSVVIKPQGLIFLLRLCLAAKVIKNIWSLWWKPYNSKRIGMEATDSSFLIFRPWVASVACYHWQAKGIHVFPYGSRNLGHWPQIRRLTFRERERGAGREREREREREKKRGGCTLTSILSSILTFDWSHIPRQGAIYVEERSVFRERHCSQKPALRLGDVAWVVLVFCGYLHAEKRHENINLKVLIFSKQDLIENIWQHTACWKGSNTGKNVLTYPKSRWLGQKRRIPVVLSKKSMVERTDARFWQTVRWSQTVRVPPSGPQDSGWVIHASVTTTVAAFGMAVSIFRPLPTWFMKTGSPFVIFVAAFPQNIYLVLFSFGWKKWACLPGCESCYFWACMQNEPNFNSKSAKKKGILDYCQEKKAMFYKSWSKCWVLKKHVVCFKADIDHSSCDWTYKVTNDKLQTTNHWVIENFNISIG